MCKHNFTQNSGISERGGRTHNETESSHSTASLIFILFMQGVGYLRSKFGSSREFVGKSERDTSEPVVSQAAIRHNRSRWSLLFRLPFDSRQNLM